MTAHDRRATAARDQDGWIDHTLRREAEGLILDEPPESPEGNRRPGDVDG